MSSEQIWSPRHVEASSRTAHVVGALDTFTANRGAVWFDDGTVVLEVGGVHFRVYQGVLSLHSPLFRALPHHLPADVVSCERKIYGQPVLVLLDCPKDWTIVLSIIFDPLEQRKFYGGPEQAPLPTSSLCACLRLGHKYQIRTLMFEAARRLQHHFPTTLAQMDTTPSNAAIELERPADAFDLANLLRDMGCYAFLPMALFRCISGPNMFSNIVGGASRVDGSWSTLSRENLVVCIPAWRSIFGENWDRSQRWRDLAAPDCTMNQSCREQVALILGESIINMVELRSTFRSWSSDWESQMCPGCVEDWKCRLSLARRETFNALPGHFGLSGWDTLTETSIE